ncbi:MAG: hypothetical protein VYB39_01540 [Pseudomonadota bacterium]|nr:hypothetical protein [Pseudomonadota bacterium]
MNSVSSTEDLVQIKDGNRASYFAVHPSGFGPGLLMVLGQEAELDALKDRIRLFAAEGYAVLGFKGLTEGSDVTEAAKTLSIQPGCISDPVCIAHGTAVPAVLSVAACFRAIAAFDALNLAKLGSSDKYPCPVIFLFGTKNSSSASAEAEKAEHAIDRPNGSRIFLWPEAKPGFSLPRSPHFDARIDGLAHSRVLELVRRLVGPYYDYVALFADHIRHEFETRDVDATMETMIEEPYVNHVATLAGGVGHEMLKRFYKYHFVDQNSLDRESITVSHTLGPDRVVIELVVRFKHDQVLDRYFPGIPPTERYVELATVLIVKFRGDKVCHEHIYWDQGSALKQIGVLDADNLPIAGAEAARKVLDVTRPSNIFMEEAWDKSRNKPL